MKNAKWNFPVGIVLLTLGVAGLTRQEDFAFGLMFTLPGLVLTVMHLLREWKRSTRKRISIPLLLLALFFGCMGLSDLGKDPFGVALGLSVALPLFLDFLLRLRSRRFPEAPGKTAVSPEETPPVPADEKVPVSTVKRAPVRICPNCGAPGRGDICEYCGGPL